MTDHNPNAAGSADDMDDLELLITYLQGKLDPERAAAVKKRLEEDAAFRDFAEPLLIAWSVPPKHEREPRPEGELEAAWAEFVRRTGFGQEPPRAKRRPRLHLILLVLFGAIVIILSEFSAPLMARFDDGLDRPFRDGGRYVAVPADTGWVAVARGVEARVAPGTTLRVNETPRTDRAEVRLEGTARFRVAEDAGAGTSGGSATAPGGLLVHTRAGDVMAGASEFDVITTGDTTDVLLHRLVTPASPFAARPSVSAVVTFDTSGVALGGSSTSYQVPIPVGESRRIIRGRVPVEFTRNR